MTLSDPHAHSPGSLMLSYDPFWPTRTHTIRSPTVTWVRFIHMLTERYKYAYSHLI